MLKYCLFSLLSLSLFSAEFQGWEGLRVLPVEGGLTASDTADVTGSGRESLFIANRRQSRIDIYNWLPPDKRKKPEKIVSPNELPMAADFERTEIILERPPFDILLKNFDDDKEKELVVLTTLPLTLHLYDLQENNWTLKNSWKLPNFNLQSISILPYKNSIFVSTVKGVIIQELKKGAQSTWMSPKETGIRRYDWWIYDIDQDGEKDLVDLVFGSAERAQFRWHKRANGQFLPAVPIGDIKGAGGSLDLSAEKPTFMFLNPIRSNTVNEYVLEEGEEIEFGINRLLPILNIREDQRTSVEIDGMKCLVEIDPGRPMMRVSELMDNGFKELGKYPILRKVKSIVSPEGKSSLLMQVGDSPDLYISKWENGRFSYPKIFQANTTEGDKKLLGLGKHGATTWWIQSLGDSLFLNLWKAGEKNPSQLEFKGIAKGLDKAYWLGNESLMVRKKYAKYATFYNLREGKAESFQAAHLKDAVETQFRFFESKKQMTVARIVDGIVQWYDKDLQPIDQTMLEDGLKIVDAALLAGDLLVLDQSGKKVHKLVKDKSGVMRKEKSFEILSANSIEKDTSLGIVLSNTKMLNFPKKGKALIFKLVNSINEKLGLPDGVKNASIEDFHIVDVAGSSRNELINVDYARRQLTLIDFSKKKPFSMASWKVYDDGKYPYSDGKDSGMDSANPYMIVSLDFDGDGIKELAMGCHDRLLIYLGRETKK